MPHKLTVLGDGHVLLVCAISREELEYEYRPKFNSITILRHDIVIIYYIVYDICTQDEENKGVLLR
jgi:hypothetical protein